MMVAEMKIKNLCLLITLMAIVAAPAWSLDVDKGQEDVNTKASAETEKSSDEKKDKKPKKEDKFFHLTDGTVHTVTGGVLRDISILCKNGKIVEMGQGVTAPDNAETLDASGYHIYPGLVSADSGGIFGSSVENSTNVFSLQMTLALAGGITTAATGNTAAKLTFGSTEGLVVKRDLFKSLRYSSIEPNAKYELRAKFEKVRQYLREYEAYQEDKKRDDEAEEPDKEWLKGKYQTCLTLIKKNAVAKFTANSAHELLDVCDLVSTFDIDAVIVGAVEGWTVASELARANVSVVVTPRKRARSDERLNRANGSSIENAAILHEHGVPLAIVPGNTSVTLWGLAGRDLLHLNMEAAFAVRGGLSEVAALRAITIDSARLLGVEHRVGSIEIGKDADFAITDGDILHYMTHTRWTVVDGEVVYDKFKDTLFDHIRPDGELESPPPDDYWPRRLGDDQ